jgi:hypothetical protein
MRGNIALALVVAAALGGCSETSSERVAGGGFETSDLQVALVDSAGQGIVGARVWLVQNTTDSVQPSSAIDSSLSDSHGLASLRLPNQAPVAIGLEAWLGDTLVGLLPKFDSTTPRPIQIKLERSRLLTLPCAPYEETILVLPGSHFKQAPPTTCEDSFFVLLPPGDWRLFSVNVTGTPTPRPIPVKGDSLPAWNPPPSPAGSEQKPGPFPPPYHPSST